MPFFAQKLKVWTNDIFDVDTPTTVTKLSLCRYASNEKW